MRISSRIVIVVIIISAILGGGVSLYVSSISGVAHHGIQLAIALALLVLCIIVAGVVSYFQISLRRALNNQDEAQKLAGLGSWERDIKTGRGYWSKNRYRLFGLEPRKIAPTTEEFYSMLHRDDREPVRNIISEALHYGENYETTYRLLNDPEQRIFISRGSIIRGENNSPISIVGTSQDITEKAAQQRLTESLIAQKDLFISRLGHDLNTPLTPLVTLLPMIRTAIHDEQQLKRIDLCISSVSHLSNLVASSMMLARRFQPLKNQLIFEKFGLSACVDEVIQGMESVTSSYSIVCHNNIEPTITLYADRGELEIVFINLLNNAVKFSPPNSLVELDAVIDNGSVMVSISDYGIGLDNEELQQIFEVFYKADSSRHELGFSGLGLSICRQIILNHGGLIAAKSDGKGHGTTITFTLLAGDAI